MTAVAYLTDVEGIWDKLDDFARDNPLVRLDGDRIELADGATFVFGGDAIDRGPWSMRLVASLLDARRRYGERVVLLAGNRDINKMRLARELAGHPPARAPREVAEAGGPALLRWILEATMGAKSAFAMRRAELEARGAPVTDEDVVASFVADVAPDGALSEYLAACQLAYRHGATLFVHGAVTSESLGAVPGRAGSIGDVDEWLAALNAFYSDHVLAYRERRLLDGGEPAWAPLIAYQAPVPGTRLHQASVVYGRPADALGNPWLPPVEVVRALHKAGIGRVVVGHTPSGDTPSVLCEDGFQMVIADNSYGRVERGTKVWIDGERLRLEARASLDGGGEVAVTADVTALSGEGPLGLRDAASGRLVKGQLASGDYLAFRFLEGYAVEQTAISADACASLRLVPPR